MDPIIAIDKNTHQLRKVSDVENGMKCNCICSECGGALEACQGDYRQYFRHHSNDRKCVGSWESQLHLLSKYIIEQNKSVSLPGWEGKFLKLTARKQEFTDVQVEISQDELKPDCLCKYLNNKGEEKTLWIEILNTHAVNEEKIKKIKERGIACVEIEVSGLFPDKEIDEDKLKDFLLNSTENRHWINNTDGLAQEEYYIKEATRLHNEDSVIKYIDEHSATAEQIFELGFVGFCFYIQGYSLSLRTHTFLRDYIKFYRSNTRIKLRRESEQHFFVSAIQFVYCDLLQKKKIVSRKRSKEDTFMLCFNNRYVIAKDAFGFADDINRIR